MKRFVNFREDVYSRMNERKLRVVIGLPGDKFSSKFLINWTQMLAELWGCGRYDLIFSHGQSSFVTFARMMTLGLDVLRGKNQKPFDNMDFDVWVTIDSDIVFTGAQVIELIESTRIYPVVSGIYMMSNGRNFACVQDWDETYFLKNGCFRFLTETDIKSWQIGGGGMFMPVCYSGMGFWAMRREALHSLNYPFFHNGLVEMGDGGVVELCGEDVAFCKNLESAGYKVMIHTGLRVGHEKTIIL